MSTGQKTEAQKVTFWQMSGIQKIRFIGKLFLFLVTFGFAYGNLLND